MDTQLNSTDILADLESYFADRDTTAGGLSVEQQAQVMQLLWEVEGIVSIVTATKQSPNTTRGLQRLRAIAGLLLALLDPGDDALDLAQEQVEAMPWGVQLQAILTHQAGHFVEEREYRQGVRYGD